MYYFNPIHSSKELHSIKMAAKELFHASEKYLEKSTYNICLGEDLYAATFQERLILGPIEFDNQSGKAKFSKKAITIPSTQYPELVKVLKRVITSFQAGETAPWETLLYKYSKLHLLMARYDIWDDEPVFKLVILWNFGNDKTWKQLVAKGDKKPIDTTDLEDKDWIHMKRGAYFKQRHVDVLYSRLITLLSVAFIKPPILRKWWRNLSTLS